ncbi:MAG: hypothetical protein HC790_11100 [Acaryochloridaceae cyanobacterium CSU_3_4]|nr:hypothetical protein [Acaryochloris sp. SU_5_25]NJN39129.1 hypothetical protein [Acaryochloridaceae cyanobacterium CSU_3_4]
MPFNDQGYTSPMQVNFKKSLVYTKEDRATESSNTHVTTPYPSGERLTKAEQERLKPQIRDYTLDTLYVQQQNNDVTGVDIYSVSGHFHCKPGFVRSIYKQMIQNGELVQLAGKSGSKPVPYHIPDVKFLTDNKKEEEDISSVLSPPTSSDPNITPSGVLTREAIQAIINELEKRRVTLNTQIRELEQELDRHIDSISTLKNLLQDF